MLIFIEQIRLTQSTECNDMSVVKKDLMAFASVLDPSLSDGIVVKLITTQSTEEVSDVIFSITFLFRVLYVAIKVTDTLCKKL